MPQGNDDKAEAADIDSTTLVNSSEDKVCKEISDAIVYAYPPHPSMTLQSSLFPTVTAGHNEISSMSSADKLNTTAPSSSSFTLVIESHPEGRTGDAVRKLILKVREKEGKDARENEESDTSIQLKDKVRRAFGQWFTCSFNNENGCKGAPTLDANGEKLHHYMEQLDNATLTNSHSAFSNLCYYSTDTKQYLISSFMVTIGILVPVAFIIMGLGKTMVTTTTTTSTTTMTTTTSAAAAARTDNTS
ncbi:hypothetical protein BDF20DRAFT_883421 [Mycotypha africana]|uniref:uncharacterized protein n=1 Tax=Mycotypha africana TaxID=64632 RepID=UPI002301ADC7|nr:uncharacterized protein BDF20DRAFT_883421 [Mycotypha africana]KAI8973651.1 hypothetical protein BDF20DRAFT_883421 [Mycotypha africana]